MTAEHAAATATCLVATPFIVNPQDRLSTLAANTSTRTPEMEDSP
jgi:hypothetical protein